MLLGKMIKGGLRLLNQFNQDHTPPLQQQKKVLKKLLQEVRLTQFGQYFDVEDILKTNNSINAFQYTIPIYTYDRIFKDWWSRALEGETDVSWPGRITRFATSSGTSGDVSKFIPVSDAMSRTMQQAAFNMLTCLPKHPVPDHVYTKPWLMIGSTNSLTDRGHCKTGYLSGINAHEPPFWIKGFYKPGTEISKIKDWEDRTEVIVQHAPKWDIGVMTGVPCWVQFTMEKVIERYGLDTIHDMWPNLSVFASGGIAYKPYEKTFDRLLARPWVHLDSYLASEGMVAYQNRPGTTAMAMVLNNGIFFEFIPFDETHFDEDGNPKPDIRPLIISEVEEGKDYALLMSTCAGTWRYLIGDVIQFTDKSRSEIIITGRTKHYLSMVGEHLSVDNMNQAILKVEDKFNIRIPEFTVAGIPSNGQFAHSWYIGTSGHPNAQELAQVLDEELKQVNKDYKVKRSVVLFPPQVQIISPDIFYDWQRHTNSFNGQSKFPRVMKGEKFERWEKFVLTKLETQV